MGGEDSNSDNNAPPARVVKGQTIAEVHSQPIHCTKLGVNTAHETLDKHESRGSPNDHDNVDNSLTLDERFDSQEGGQGAIQGNDASAVATDDKKKKLIIGKCAKPDKSDIKLVVKFAHEKLDSLHVQKKVFDKLVFNLLIAGELELIDWNSISEECSTYINVAKT